MEEKILVVECEKEREAIEKFKKLTASQEHSELPDDMQLALVAHDANPQNCRDDVSLDQSQTMLDDSCDITAPSDILRSSSMRKGQERAVDSRTTTSVTQVETPAQRIKRLFREKRRRAEPRDCWRHL